MQEIEESSSTAAAQKVSRKNCLTVERWQPLAVLHASTKRSQALPRVLGRWPNGSLLRERMPRTHLLGTRNETPWEFEAGFPRGIATYRRVGPRNLLRS